MKIILLGSFPVCNSLYESLLQTNQLHAVCFEESVLRISDQNYLDAITQQKISTFVISKNNIDTDFKNWLQEQKVDLVIVCGFSLKIPADVLAIPTHGFLNIHFGKLPENRGPDPLFWSIKNGDKETAITVHQMDKNWDTGAILIKQPIPIIIGETMGMLNSKMSYLLRDLAKNIIDQIQDPTNLTPQSSDKSAVYNKRPNKKNMSIHWETQTADEIENLVNACNPKYGGATTYYQGAPIKIVEVSPVDSQTPLFGRTPGEVIHAHPQEGLFVCCKYGQLLRINIISSDAGVLTGTKYVNMGIRQGHRFTTSQLLQQKEQITK